jgi:proteic killer suppression protein
MIKKLGKECAAKLSQRLMELQAAESLSVISHLPPARCHELAGKEAGVFSVDLKHPLRLLFVPADQPIPKREDGSIDRDQVKEIEIIAIKDTH